MWIGKLHRQLAEKNAVVFEEMSGRTGIRAFCTCQVRVIA